jgi:hypothetical protein
MKNPSIKRSAVWRGLLVCLLTASVLPTFAQTVTISPYTYNYWAGINTSKVLGLGTNAAVVTGTPTTITFGLSGASGVTPTFLRPPPPPALA